MESSNLYGALSESLTALVGLRCWGVCMNEGSGSNFSLNFGDGKERRVPLKNARLSFELRNFESSRSILVEDASWRLHDGSAVRCTWSSSGVDNKFMTKEMAELEGAVVKNIELRSPGMDVDIVFNCGLVLQLFSTWMGFGDEEGDNFSVFCDGGVYIVGNGSKIRHEPSIVE